MPDLPGDEAESSIPLTAARVLDILQNGMITEMIGLLRRSSNYTFLLTVAQDDIEINAVYKPQRGERPLWDFPDGTLCLRERAAFLTSESLNWGLVPPTALREGPQGLGSVQFFVDHDPDVNYFSLDETFAPQLQKLMLFDYITNNADRKGGHCLVDEQGHIWGIDHGITFHPQSKLRTVIWDFAGQPIPSDLLADLECLHTILTDENSDYCLALRDLLTGAETLALQARIRHMLRLKKYPLPGPGANYPWPPV